MPGVQNESIDVTFTCAEKHKLVQLAGINGQSVGGYIRGHVLANSYTEDEVLCILLNELAGAAMALERVEVGQSAPDYTAMPAETMESQRTRIAKQVRASLSNEQIEALTQFLKPAFERGL